MPFGANHQDAVIKLGRALKSERSVGEQFCVFAFDMTVHSAMDPDPSSFSKDDLPFDPNDYPAANWNAAFYSVVGPTHTEVAILSTYGQWLHNYSSVYGAPANLHVYSALIPCFRDGNHGMCSERIHEAILWTNKVCRTDLSLRIGWSNDDRDVEQAHATKHGLADMEDDDIGISIYPSSMGTSIAGRTVDKYGN